MRHISFVMGMPHMLAERHMDSWPRWWAIESENKLPRRPCWLSPRRASSALASLRRVLSRLLCPLLVYVNCQDIQDFLSLFLLSKMSCFFFSSDFFFCCLFSVSRKFHSSENWVRAVRHRMDRWVSLWCFVSTQQQSVSVCVCCVCVSAVRVCVACGRWRRTKYRKNFQIIRAWK